MASSAPGKNTGFFLSAPPARQRFSQVQSLKIAHGRILCSSEWVTLKFVRSSVGSVENSYSDSQHILNNDRVFHACLKSMKDFISGCLSLSSYASNQPH